MKLAVLFWFYKELEVCDNRLQLLKEHNPGLKIYGLFGGDHADAQQYADRLGPYLDDFYASPDRERHWKWINGDLLLLDWYEQRGASLEWDSVVVVQWDLLVLDSLERQFAGIREGELFLSGLRELDAGIESQWDWTQPGGSERHTYLAFLEHVRREYGYEGRPWCCLFILQVFPRSFFEAWLRIKDKELGMLEYKIPTYARILDAPLYRKDIGVRWYDSVGENPLNAIPEEIGEEYIRRQLEKTDGWRLFHPYYKGWPPAVS